VSVREGVPLARTKEGAVLGVDQRRLRGMIPGRVEARHLLPGDRIQATGVEVTVQELPQRSVFPGRVHVLTHTDAGSPIAVERDVDEQVFVISAGAFDRE
jgi:hypothetical protein